MGLVGLALTAFAGPRAHGQEAGDEILSPAAAATLLREPAVMDAGSRRVIGRAETAYRKLRTLKTINRDGGMTGVAHLARPLRFHLHQKLVTGEPVALAVSDGSEYYEYRHRSKQYLQRPAATLKTLALPVNVRLFMEGQSAAVTLKGLDGNPTVREYGYRHRGARGRLRHGALAGRQVAFLHQSTLLRHGHRPSAARGEWGTHHGD
jgi:hypothetical protein